MNDYTLEGCVDSVESAVIATRAGANRLELCANLMIGGTTPTAATFKQVRKACDNRVNVLIRPRFGDFCYTEHEVAIIEQEIEMFRKLGADGVVIGALTPDGNVDWKVMERFLAAAGDMWVTMHRAFDMCREPYEELERAIAHGMEAILTSGQADTCLQGKACIQELVQRSAGRIQILVGSGVAPDILQEMVTDTGAWAFHMSGKEVLDSPMTYRKPNVHMGLESISEYDIWRTKEENVRRAVEVLRGICKSPDSN